MMKPTRMERVWVLIIKTFLNSNSTLMATSANPGKTTGSADRASRVAPGWRLGDAPPVQAYHRTADAVPRGIRKEASACGFQSRDPGFDRRMAAEQRHHAAAGDAAGRHRLRKHARLEIPQRLQGIDHRTTVAH